VESKGGGIYMEVGDIDEEPPSLLFSSVVFSENAASIGIGCAVDTLQKRKLFPFHF
jgi:hypothetical protein